MIYVCTKFHIHTFNGWHTQMQHTALISEIMALEIRVYVVLKDYVQGTFSVLQNWNTGTETVIR